MKAADRDPKNMTNHDCAAVLMYAANTSNEIALEAVQMLGGNGYSKFTFVLLILLFGKNCQSR